MGTGLKQTFVTGLTDTSLSDKEGVGAHRYENGRWYKYVKYDEGASLDIVAGDFLNYKAATGYVNSVVTADASEADTLPVGAGIALSTVTVDLTFMWIQIKGLATLSLDPNAATADGEAAVPGGDKLVAVATSEDKENTIGTVVDDSEKLIALDCPF